jgi:hypothetical protein
MHTCICIAELTSTVFLDDNVGHYIKLCLKFITFIFVKIMTKGNNVKSGSKITLSLEVTMEGERSHVFLLQVQWTLH